MNYSKLFGDVLIISRHFKEQCQQRYLRTAARQLRRDVLLRGLAEAPTQDEEHLWLSGALVKGHHAQVGALLSDGGQSDAGPLELHGFHAKGIQRRIFLHCKSELTLLS